MSLFCHREVLYRIGSIGVKSLPLVFNVLSDRFFRDLSDGRAKIASGPYVPVLSVEVPSEMRFASVVDIFCGELLQPAHDLFYGKRWFERQQEMDVVLVYFHRQDGEIRNGFCPKERVQDHLPNGIQAFAPVFGGKDDMIFEVRLGMSIGDVCFIHNAHADIANKNSRKDGMV